MHVGKNPRVKPCVLIAGFENQNDPNPYRAPNNKNPWSANRKRIKSKERERERGCLKPETETETQKTLVFFCVCKWIYQTHSLSRVISLQVNASKPSTVMDHNLIGLIRFDHFWDWFKVQECLIASIWVLNLVCFDC